jgi:hypothetical protein
MYVCVAAAALGFVVYEVHRSGLELESRVALIGEHAAKMKTYTELSRLIEETEEPRAELASYVLRESNTSAFLTEVEALGASLGVTLSTLGLDVVKTDGAFDDLTIKFSVKGDNAAVKQMLTTLESLPYHNTINSVSLVRQSDGFVEGTIQLTLSLSSYDN